MKLLYWLFMPLFVAKAVVILSDMSGCAKVVNGNCIRFKVLQFDEPLEKYTGDWFTAEQLTKFNRGRDDL